MLPALEGGSGLVRNFLDNFVAETASELFPTREAVLEFYRRTRTSSGCATGRSATT